MNKEQFKQQIDDKLESRENHLVCLTHEHPNDKGYRWRLEEIRYIRYLIREEVK